MIVLGVGQWHRFDDHVDKIATRIIARVLEAGDPPPGVERALRAHVLIYRKFSHRWASFSADWPADGPLG
jgi:hypothetical protein